MSYGQTISPVPAKRVSNGLNQIGKESIHGNDYSGKVSSISPKPYGGGLSTFGLTGTETIS